ncbi:hypothetical protein [Secundilactobacillus kimchicus]|nr:hypothetical protein [Secundilactobacillus kimchicus]
MKSKWIRLRNIVLIMGMFLGVLVVGTTVAQADVSEVNPLSESVTL